MRVTPTGREALVAEARLRLERQGWPRVQASLLLVASGGSAFLASVGLLAAGVHSMALRYTLAALAGYLVFLVLVRVWIAWQRGSLDLAPDLVELGPDGHTSVGGPRGSWFGGGRSGGGGGGGTFDEVPRVQTAIAAPQAPSTPSGGGWSLGDWLDSDDAWWIVLALALAAAGVIAVLYVVYAAPLLLAEVALDAAVMSGIYRRLRREDARHWATGVLRHTWIPAVVIVACAAGVGFCAQKIAPEARSIGGVVRTMASR